MEVMATRICSVVDQTALLSENKGYNLPGSFSRFHFSNCSYRHCCRYSCLSSQAIRVTSFTKKLVEKSPELGEIPKHREMYTLLLLSESTAMRATSSSLRMGEARFQAGRFDCGLGSTPRVVPETRRLGYVVLGSAPERLTYQSTLSRTAP